jgi:chemotaxis methyl-accepting protein methylase
MSEEVEFHALLDKISRDRAFRCRSYKDKCLRRRIAVRLRARGIPNYTEYAELLDSDPREYDRLLDTLTINVTKLFRNWESYDALARLVVPVLWSSPAAPLNVWSAGCASGDEACSLAILFHRHAAAAGEGARVASRVRILGTDIDSASLIAAARGVFPEPAFADTPPDIRATYFAAGLPAEAAPDVREMLRFERRDLIQQPPPVGQHLICCRNVIIYFDRETQEALFARFHEALVPGGYLMLGKVETLFGAARGLFTPVDARERIFRRT